MKKMIALSLLLLFAAISFAQQIEPPAKPTIDYLQKSKKQKKMGWILVASGAALIVTSRIIPQGESKGFTGSDLWFGLPVEEFENDGIRAGLALYGTAAALGSIPFFIAAGKNKKRSKTTTGFLKLEKAPIPQQNLVSPFLYPAIGLRISI